MQSSYLKIFAHVARNTRENIMIITNDYVLFYGGPFSNWAESPFELDGITFNCSEQYFMYRKALQFGDTTTANKILKEKSPAIQKELGKKVSGYVESEWNNIRYDVMLTALRAKFQLPAFKAALLKTEHKTIVEASPYDKIWGIGLTANDPRALNPSEWLGSNLLGKCLMQVRDEIV